MSPARVRWAAPLLLLALVVSTSCTHVPMDRDPQRPTTAAPEFLAARFVPWNFHAEPSARESTSAYQVLRFNFTTYDDAVGGYLENSGELYLPAGPGPFPLIAVAPILGGAEIGYAECRFFAGPAARAGFASFWLNQDAKLLRPHASAVDFERMLREWVRSMQKTLDLLLDRYPVDPDRLGSFGISLGAIRMVLLVAAEPRLKANVLCLAGAGFPEILAESRESLIDRYLERRKTTLQVSEEVLLNDIRVNLVSEPADLAGCIAPERVLMILARFDRHVPIATGWRLHEALGRPETRVTPLGHYSSILLFPWVNKHALRYFRHALSL